MKIKNKIIHIIILTLLIILPLIMLNNIIYNNNKISKAIDKIPEDIVVLNGIDSPVEFEKKLNKINGIEKIKKYSSYFSEYSTIIPTSTVIVEETKGTASDSSYEIIDDGYITNYGRQISKDIPIDKHLDYEYGSNITQDNGIVISKEMASGIAENFEMESDNIEELIGKKLFMGKIREEKYEFDFLDDYEHQSVDYEILKEEQQEEGSPSQTFIIEGIYKEPSLKSSIRNTNINLPSTNFYTYLPNLKRKTEGTKEFIHGYNRDVCIPIQMSREDYADLWYFFNRTDTIDYEALEKKNITCPSEEGDFEYNDVFNNMATDIFVIKLSDLEAKNDIQSLIDDILLESKNSNTVRTLNDYIKMFTNNMKIKVIPMWFLLVIMLIYSTLCAMFLKGIFNNKQSIGLNLLSIGIIVIIAIILATLISLIFLTTINIKSILIIFLFTILGLVLSKVGSLYTILNNKS